MILNHQSLLLLQQDKCFSEFVHVGPSSIDLTLSNSFSEIRPKEGVIILGDCLEYHHTKDDYYRLAPGGFVLASTQQTLSIPTNLSAYVEGRSSVGRAGLQVHNAGFIDPGFQGQITLELANQTKYPMILKIGMRICQVVFMTMSADTSKPYDGKYINQSGATGSRLHLDK